MFLKPLLEKNPRFVAAAIDLHQAGAIPSNSYVLDLDTVAANTTTLMAEAQRHDLTVYAMTKQLGRAPGVLDAMTGAGVDGYVAVDMACARPIVNNGHNLGHLGHLVQVPFAEADEAAAMRPDYWTVFSANKAAEASAAATRQGLDLDLLVRVFDPDDEFYSGHEGGATLADLPGMIDTIESLPGVRFAGLTTFPALLFEPEAKSARNTHNVETLARAVEVAQNHMGSAQRLEVNLPGTTSSVVLGQLAEAGATQVEPGHGLTGTTPLHAVKDLPEIPAVLYVSEVAHIHQGTPFSFGGGLYIDPVFGPYDTKALIAHDSSELGTDLVPIDIPDPAAIDYYAKLHPGEHRIVEEGASVVHGFRIQAFVTRAFVTGLSGIAAGSPTVAGIWNGFGDPVSWGGGQR